MNQQSANAKIKEAEQKIRRILLDLSEDVEIESVEVDTRRYANCRVDILAKGALS